MAVFKYLGKPSFSFFTLGGGFSFNLSSGGGGVAIPILELREQILGLRDETTENGRQSTEALKVVGVDAFPDGVTLNAQIITVSDDNVVLEDWELGGYRVNLTGANQVLRNNLWTSPEVVSSSTYPIQINATATNAIIEYNTIDGFDGYGGPATMMNMPTSGDGAAAVGAVNTHIHHNRFLFPNSDVIKSSGNGTLIEWNYYGPLTNYPVGTTDYNAATTYAVGDKILANDGVHLFVSLVSGNVGNTPPTGKTDDAFWENLDPHGDANTVTGSDGVGVTIARNLVDWGNQITRAIGVTQFVRVVRNTGSATNMGPVTLEENLVPEFSGFYPLAVSFIRDHFDTVTYSLGGFASEDGVFYVSLQDGNEGNTPSTSPTWWAVTTDINAAGPIAIQNNWIGAGTNGNYYTDMDDVVDVWFNNVDAVTDVAIPAPVLRASSAYNVTAVVGQSENAISLFLQSSLYNQQARPDLLAGVDGVMIISGHNSASGSPERVDVTQDNIDAGLLNAGAVAWFNFMHHTSGGAGHVLVDLSDPGTGMEAMMDDDNADRDGSIDVATIAFARAEGFDPDLAIYCWSNAEASASPDLIANRNPQLIGRNADGSPYDFTDADSETIERCLIDTAGQGMGLLSDTCKLSLMLVHPRILTALDLIDPANRNYRSTSDGSQIAGMTKSNGYPAVQARHDFLAQSYLDSNRGKVGVSQAVSLYGDYADGIKLASGQSSIHPSVQEADGQILSAQHIAANAAYTHDWIEIPSSVDMVAASDGLSVAGSVSLPAGTTLKTIRGILSETVAAPKGHQQTGGMGFALWRSGDTFSELDVYPIWRDGEGPSSDYEGAVVVTDEASGQITVTLSEPLIDGDIVDFGTSGQYASFIMDGYPDYDARMYKDCLIAHDPALYAATGYYGVPVEPQARYIVSGVGAAGSGTWDITATDGGATITDNPTPPDAPTVTAGDGSAALET